MGGLNPSPIPSLYYTSPIVGDEEVGKWVVQPMIALLARYAEGVQLQSPGSRSAPWVRSLINRRYPEGVTHLTRYGTWDPAVNDLYNTFGVKDLGYGLPRVRRCAATLGSGV